MEKKTSDMSINEDTVRLCLAILNAANNGASENTQASPQDAAGSSLASAHIDRFVIARCGDAGVHAGVLRAASSTAKGTECRLTEARRLWYWRVPEGKGDFLSGVSQHGLGEGCKIGDPIEVTLSGVCEVIPCSQEAEESIRGYETHKRA